MRALHRRTPSPALARGYSLTPVREKVSSSHSEEVDAAASAAADGGVPRRGFACTGLAEVEMKGIADLATFIPLPPVSAKAVHGVINLEAERLRSSPGWGKGKS